MNKGINKYATGLRKISRFAIGSALFAVCVYLASLVYVLSFSLNTNIPDHVDAVLVLGAKVNIDNTPSRELYNRTTEGVSLLKQKRADYIMFTGGVGLGPVSEAETARKIAIQQGVSKEKILI